MLLSALAATTLLIGCGSSGNGNSGTAADSTGAATHPAGARVALPRFVERAEKICVQGKRETQALGVRLSQVLSHSSPQDAITNALVKPGIGILNRERTSLKDLGPAPDSRTVEIFLGLFDPIIELAHQRLQATASDEPDQARSLEVMIARLEDERSAAARRLGLDACGVPFSRALRGAG